MEIKELKWKEKYIPSIWCGGVVFKGFKREKKEKNLTNKNSTKQCQCQQTVIQIASEQSKLCHD